MPKTYDEVEEREWIISRLNETAGINMDKIRNILIVCTIARVTGESVLTVSKEMLEAYELTQKLWREI